MYKKCNSYYLSKEMRFMEYNAIEIAKYVINNATYEISNLELQKIMYYIQAAFLVERNKQCFREELCAWEYGPVVKEVYDEFKVYGRSIIPPQEQADKIVFDAKTFGVKRVKDELIICEGDKIIINRVLKAYSDIQDPFELVEKTHSEDPWINARITPEKIIKNDEIRSYYALNKNKLYNRSN